MSTKIKILFLSNFLLINLFFIACNKENYTVKDLEGKYWLYKASYGGLWKKKLNTFVVLGKDSTMNWGGCSEDASKWYISNNNLIEIHADNNATNTVQKTSYKIKNNNLYMYNILGLAVNEGK
jgi:hypothetical protein